MVPDLSLGTERSQVVSDTVRGRPAAVIQGGAPRGGNLFHSFEQFGVDGGQQVYFANPVGIERIFGRVTGSLGSRIEGTLGVLGAADLFLLNPNGIVFGPGARLDIAGSFTASTAQSWQFADGVSFSAVNPQGGDLLTVSVPLGIQLNQPGVGAIASTGRLQAGANLTLSGKQLYLEGQVQAGGDLNLQAQELVTIRDTVDQPFVARSGGDLTIQGNQGIDILALRHLDQTPFVSGGNLTLMSDGVISGDAHFKSGGNLGFLTLAGEPGQFVSFYDPIILADGDVMFGDYTGVALKVEATGSIEAGNIEITGPDTTFVADGSGSDEDLLASSRAVILRAGNNAQLPSGSITVNSINTSNIDGGDAGPIILNAQGDITIRGALNASSVVTTGNAGKGGNISISSKAGQITVNGYIRAHSLVEDDQGNASSNGGSISISSESGNIELKKFLYSFSWGSHGESAHGGSISISSKSGDINMLGASSFSQSEEYNTGNGGDISISTQSGDISIADGLMAGSFARSQSNPRNSGDGGNINIFSESGNIDVQDFAQGASYSLSGNAGNGGSISVVSNVGDITVKDLVSVSTSKSGNAGNGGSIFVSSGSKNVTIGELSSYSLSETGGLGNAGSISILAREGMIQGSNNLDQSEGILAFAIAQSGGASGLGGTVRLESRDISDLRINTLSSTGQSGSVSILNTEDSLAIKNLELTVSGQIEIRQPFFPAGRVLELSDFGQAGNTLISSAGDVSLDSVKIQGDANGSQPAGNVAILSPGQVLLNNSQISSNSINSGDAGEINITGKRFSLSNGSRLSAATFGSGQGGTISINASETVVLGEGGQNSASLISVEASGAGKPGDIIINTPKLSLSDTARITATSTQTATNLAGGGSINLSANQIDLAGLVGVFAETAGQSPGGVLTLQSYQNSPNLDIKLTPTAQISASTFGSGSGGNLIITAPDSIQIRGAGQLSSETSGSGGGGNIRIASHKLSISDGTRVSTTARLPDPLPDPLSNFNLIDVNQGGPIVDADAFGSGVSQFFFTVAQPGERIVDLDLRFSAAHSWTSDLDVVLESPQGSRVLLFGGFGGDGDNFQDTLLDNTAPTRLNNGIAPFVGSFSLNPSIAPLSTFNGESALGTWILTVIDTVESDSGTLFRVGDIAPWGTAIGTQLLLHTQNTTTTSLVPVPPPIPTAANPNLGRGGTITIAADTFNLKNASLLAETEGFTRGGDINIKTNQLNLNDGNITVRSTGSGDSGNINIESGRSIILRNNSVIETDAGGSGNGGNINVKTPFLISLPGENSDIIANAIGGNGGQIKITAQNLFNFEQKDGQNRNQLRSNRTNDISASSETGTDGTINLNTPNVNPANNLAQLPTDLVDGSNLIERTLCAAGNKSKFLITGRGGLPTAPTDTLSVLPLWNGQDPEEMASVETPELVLSIPFPIRVEAQNWMLNSEGKIVLYADLPTPIQNQLLQEIAQRSPHCRQLRQGVAESS